MYIDDVVDDYYDVGVGYEMVGYCDYCEYIDFD